MQTDRLPAFLLVSILLALVAATLGYTLPGLNGIASWLAPWMFFFLLTGVIVVFGKKAVQHRNPHIFTGITLGATLGKLALSLLFLFIYRQMLAPEGRTFLVLFFILYVGFTVYEIMALHAMAKKEALRRK